MRDDNDDPPPSAAGEEATGVRTTGRAGHRVNSAGRRSANRQRASRKQRNSTRNRSGRTSEETGTDQGAHDVMLTLQRRRGNAIQMYNNTMRSAMQHLREPRGEESAGLHAFAPLLFDLFSRLQGRSAEGLGSSLTRT